MATDHNGAKRTLDEFQMSIEIATAIKQAIRNTGLSREQVVDEINAYFCRSKDGVQAEPPTCRNPLSIHVFNNYLGKPTQYPIPAYYLPAIHYITQSLKPSEVILAVEGGQVVSGAEIRRMAVEKLERHMEKSKQWKNVLEGRN